MGTFGGSLRIFCKRDLERGLAVHSALWRPLSRRQLRAFSTPSNSQSQEEYIKQRSKYRDELKDLRRVWTTEIAERREMEQKQKAMENEKVVLAKAIRLREKRKESVLRQEADKKAKAAAKAKYLAHLENNLTLHNQRVAEQSKIDTLYRMDLEEEKKTWITEENINMKITPALFENPATTGLLNHDSELWRWHFHSMKLDRLKDHSETTSDFAGSSLAERLEFRGQVRSARKMMVQDFLEPMIESGSDRAEFDDLVDKFTSKFEELDVWQKADEVDDFFDEDNLSGSSFESSSLNDDGSDDMIASPSREGVGKDIDALPAEAEAPSPTDKKKAGDRKKAKR